MTEWFHTIGAGALQGLTEFLPVSSSGHLFLFRNFFQTDLDTALVILLHMGTLLAVLFFVRKEIWAILQGLWKKEIKAIRLTFAVVAGTVPALIVGLLIKGWLDTYLSINWVIGINLWITGLALFLTDRIVRGATAFDDIGMAKGFWIGVFQACAILPGISRSGFTFLGALILGVQRESALKFSFLLSIPAIMGGFILEARSMSFTGPNIVGFLVSAITGWFALWFLYQLARIRKLCFFSIYCWVVGTIVLFL